MATTVKDRAQLPDVAVQVVELVERLGFRWQFNYDYPTPTTEKRIQIRNEKHYAPATQVTQYAAAMRRGDKFPPVVMTHDGYLVDGNTRVEAAHRNKFPTVQAIVLDDNWEDARDDVRQRLHTLGAAFNVRHGRGIDRAEIGEAIRTLGSNADYTASRIASLLGATEGMVAGVLAEQKARDRAERLGIHVNGSIPPSQLRKIGQAPGLHDAPFTQILKLTQDAGLSASEVGEVLKQVKAAPDDGAALTIITEHRESRGDQIANFKASGKSRPAVSAQLRQRLGFILGFEPNPTGLVEHNPTLVDLHCGTLRRAITVLQAALAGQDGMLATAGGSS